MSDSGHSLHLPRTGQGPGAEAAAANEALDAQALMSWIYRHWVVAGGAALIVASVIWKAQFLHHLYFYQDDYVDLDIARSSPLSWHYLSLVGNGHFFVGLRLITWLLARISLYNWGLDSTVLLVFVAWAGFAALRLLRTMFEDRPVVLILLAVYLFSPLTLPDLGWWWCGMESLPLQVAIFMALHSHVRYVRSDGTRHLLAASLWIVFGMLFFVKAVILPLLLFAITSGFLMGPGSWLGGAVRTVRQHWRAWLAYGILVAGYTAVFLAAFHASGGRTHLARSASDTLTFISVFVKDTLLPGVIGGPWAWLSAGPGHMYAISWPPRGMVWFAVLAVVAVGGLSVWVRTIAWRAWLTFILWVAVADVLPVVVGRLGFGLATLFGLETRYLADAASVLAICTGLAFCPMAEASTAPVAGGERRSAVGATTLRYSTVALVAIFLLGSIWSSRAYEKVTNGAPLAAAYISNAERAVSDAAPGTKVLDHLVPSGMVMPLFGTGASAAQVIGGLETGRLAGRLHWIGTPQGTIDGLRMFGADGRLYPAVISGVYTKRRPGRGLKACWPDRKGAINVYFPRATTPLDRTLFISYIWSSAPAVLTVVYDNALLRLPVRPGIHNAYLPVTGAARGFSIYGTDLRGLCVGAAESGQLVPF